MDPFFHTGLSISDSLKTVRKSVLIYETIIKSPYRVLYSYTYGGKIYHHKSHLLWDKPYMKETDSIAVYINDSEKSAIQL